MTDYIETFLRGVVEQLLDHMTEEEYIRPLVTMMSALRPTVSSVEDAIYGHIIGEINGQMMASLYSTFKREPTEGEIEIIANSIIHRSIEIRSKIREFANM
jgi:hypothetical protein